MRRLFRLWRTVSYLQFIQISGRIIFRLARPQPDLSPAPLLRLRQGYFIPPARRQARLIAPDVFYLLNETGSLAAHGWDDPARTKLWRYNQHYFDDLNAADAEQRIDWHRALVTEWINANPPGKGTGWEPYPVSMRIVNWIKWALTGHTLNDSVCQSLAVQTRWLTSRMEVHLLGNHLFANGKALVFSGMFFDGPEAERWLEQGISLLEREICEQILPDGGQFELSPMYHALALEDVLDLVNVLRAYGCTDVASRWCERIPAMLHWLQVMSHPDQSLAFFNDTALGVAPDNGQLTDYANRLGLHWSEHLMPLTYLQDSGYVRMTADRFVLLADLARIGPDYLPGHAHADTLSVELSFAGQRVFVNSGISEYGTGPERLRQRSTEAHNTVVVEGQNSSEVWSGFRVGRRARPMNICVKTDERGVLCAQASHDGYRHLRGRPIVSRRIELSEQCVQVVDSVSGNAKAESRLHLHPALDIELASANAALLMLPDGQQLRVLCDGGPIRLEDTTWHPEFGISKANCCLILPLVAGRASLTIETV
ncbi:heparinase II/III family protein [Gammaproteobacteria bacterium]|nr:heparinase II/III family protein [Gammaproteobacteria bacterium]